MYLLGLGIVLLLLKWLAVGPVALWAWWIVLAPFVLAMAWWAWADSSGYTKRKAAERDSARKAARIERQRDKLKMPTKKPR